MGPFQKERGKTQLSHIKAFLRDKSKPTVEPPMHTWTITSSEEDALFNSSMKYTVRASDAAKASDKYCSDRSCVTFLP